MNFNEWRNYKWKELCTLKYGKSLKNYRDSSGNIPVYGTNGPIGFTDKYLSDKSGVIIGRKGAYRGIHFSNEPFYVIDTAFYLDIIKPEILDMKFAYYHLLTKDINSMDSGSAIPSTSREDFYSLTSGLPSIKSQKTIAHILSTLDEKIEVNNRINRTLEDMAQAIFKRWFVDFEFPDEEGDPYKTSGGEMVESELGLIPKAWRIEKFEEVFYFQEGPGIRNWQYVEKGTKFINIRCINGNDLHLGTANMISNDEAMGKYKHFMIDAGDVVMSTSGTLGKYSIVREDHLPLCLNTSVIRFKPLNGSDHYSYMYAYLTSNEFYNHLITKASGSVQKNFGPMHLKQIKLVYPINSIIKQLNSVISPIIESSLHVKKENDKLKSIMDTLLPKLMTGEIQVSLENN